MKKDIPSTDLNFIKSHANRFLNSQENIPSGSIVYDKKNEEVSFVAGKVDRLGNEYGTILGVERTTKPTYLLITKQNWENKQDTELRCRYVKSANLDIIESGNSFLPITDDIKEFCKNQCIQECNKDCILWKYKK